MPQRLEVNRRDLHQTRLVPDPDATRALADGQVRLAVGCFALTANNITYAAFGESMNYWRFFPTADAEWGCIPVWGFADVVESRAAGVATGERVYGYLPMGTHLVVDAARVTPYGFADAAPHRADLAPIYNQLLFCRADPAYAPAREGLIALLRPLFTTSFLIDDFLAGEGFFGARQLVLTSASSKTAYGTAHCLARRRGPQGAPRIVGLTSPAHLEFVRSLPCYDAVLCYDEVHTMDAATPTALIDFAGDAGVRRTIHERFEHTLAYDCAVGGTHWEALGTGGGLPGPRPTLFFAPAQANKRAAAPPQGWGPAGLQQRVARAWQAFVAAVADPADPWLVVKDARGAAAVTATYRQLLEGRADPREGWLLAL